MNLNICFKIILVNVILLSFSGTIFSTEVLRREALNLDESLSEQSNIYSTPQKIYISKIEGINPQLSNNTNEWIKFLYYYSITRLNLNDIPYNYLIDQNGQIYEGSRGGIGVNPGLEAGENVVLIGLMSEKSTLSPRMSSSLNDFVENLSYEYGIKDGSWDLVDLKLKKSEGSFSYLVSSSSNDSLRDSLSSTFKQVQWSNEEHLEYIGKIESVEYPKEVVIGKKLNVKVTIRNENDFTWFTTPNYIYLSTKDSVDSVHAINSEWESFSKPTHIQDEVVKSKDTTEISFNLLAKSKPGEYTQSFLFLKSTELPIENTSFDVTFNIVKGDNTVIELVSPEYGFVNIRECRWYSCEKVEVANEGDVFITTKKEEGWYEIIYGDDKRGWVYQKYAKEI